MVRFFPWNTILLIYYTGPRASLLFSQKLSLLWYTGSVVTSILIFSICQCSCFLIFSCQNLANIPYFLHTQCRRRLSSHVVLITPKIFVYFIAAVRDCTLKMQPHRVRSPNLRNFICLLQDNKRVLKQRNLPFMSTCERVLTGIWYFQFLIKFSSWHFNPLLSAPQGLTLKSLHFAHTVYFCFMLFSQ